MFLIGRAKFRGHRRFQEAPVRPHLSVRGMRTVLGGILVAALCGALLAQSRAADLPQAYAEALLVGEDLFTLITETLETGLWILFNLITPPT